MDLIGDITAIRTPMPRPGDVVPADCYPDACEQAEQERRADALGLEAQSDGLEEDPLLLAIRDARTRREAADREIRLLLAYGREFHGERPYKLEPLATASGMTVSGARTAYGSAEVEAVAREINRAPRTRPTKTQPGEDGP